MYCFCLFLVSLMCWDEPPLVAPTEARPPAEEKKLFKLPPGFEAQLVASEPDIAKPMNLAFDARGRLWVTSSLEYPFPAQGRAGRDMVHILEDFAPDGKARKITTFAKDLNIPLGVYPLYDGALVYSINSIDRFQGRAGGLYQQRTQLYEGFGSRDTHGMVNSFTRGFDGWLYACHGYANDSSTQGSDGQVLKMNSGNVFRMRLDGSHVEAFTRGQVNPFGMCLDPWGNLYTADCHTRPMTQLLRGAYYDSFGKPHDGLGYGPNMIGHMHDSTGLAGLVFYDADQFPAAYQGTMFVGNVVTSRINHDKIVYHGSTPQAVAQPDFLSSDDPWFRPVYIILGPDGALYVADFYNRIIGHYEVPLSHPGRDRARGRIWRIVYTGPGSKPSPILNIQRSSVNDLIAQLDQANLSVRLLATHELVDRGEQAVDPVHRALSTATPRQSAHLHWVLHRLGKLSEQDIARALRHDSPLVKVHGLRILTEQPKYSETIAPLVISCLSHPHALVRRCAAEALGSASSPALPLLRLLLPARRDVSSEDTHLLHVTRMALRNQLLRLSETETSQLATHELTALGDICLGAASPQGGRMALLILQQGSPWTEDTPRLVQHAARYLPDAVPALTQLRQNMDLSPERRGRFMQGLLQGVRQGQAALTPSLKADAAKLSRLLCQSSHPASVQIGLEICSNAHLIDQFDLVTTVIHNNRLPEPTRTLAVNTLGELNPRLAEPELIKCLTDANLPHESRERAAMLLTGMNRSSARQGLLQAISFVSSRLANVIAYNLANSITGAQELLAAVESQKLPPQILLTTSVQLRILNHKRADFTERYAKLTRDLPPAEARLADLVRTRAARFEPHKTDTSLGVQLFKQHCAACHQLGNQGAKVGPQLDGVGIRGTERLLEDILDPNRNIDQAFRSTVLVLHDGRTLTGLVLREEGQVLILADQQGKEQKIDKSIIEERKLIPSSPMPANFDTALTEAELNNLLAYLLTQRAKN